MSQITFSAKADLIAALTARKPWVKAFDKKITDAHRAAEKAELERFRKRCRELAGLSYEALKERKEVAGYSDVGVKFKPPSCPRLQMPDFEALMRQLALTSQEKFTVTSNGLWSEAHWFLTHDENARKDACS